MQIVPSFNKLLTNGHAKSTTLGDEPKVVPFNFLCGFNQLNADEFLKRNEAA